MGSGKRVLNPATVHEHAVDLGERKIIGNARFQTAQVWKRAKACSRQSVLLLHSDASL